IPRIQTLNAGMGFLSQGSKRIHFGLGKSDVIEFLQVRWPDGASERFKNIAFDARYYIKQGAGVAVSRDPRDQQLAIHGESLDGDPVSATSRVVISARLPMPGIDYDEIQADQQVRPPGPLLLTLWSTTCGACLQELADFATHADELRAAGVGVMALNVDELADDPTSDLSRSRELLQQLEFPFAAAAVDEETAGGLDVFQRSFLNLQQPLPVPSSFLSTADGQVAVIYRGPVSVAQVLADVKLLNATPREVRQASAPLSGRWHLPPTRPDPQAAAIAFLRNGFTDAGIKYLEKYLGTYLSGNGWGPRELWPTRKRLGELCDTLADFYRIKNDPVHVMKVYELALRFDENSLPARMNLGKGLVQVGKVADGIQMLEQARQLKPDNGRVLADLGIAYAISGDLDHAAKVFQAWQEVEPEAALPRLQLGRVAQQQRQYAQAAAQYRACLELSPNERDALVSLAWILLAAPTAELRDVSQAEQLIRRAVELGGPVATGAIADLQAALMADQGNFTDALALLDGAIAIAQTHRNSALLKQLQLQRELYQQRRVFRLPPPASSSAGGVK
ncbi:MAG: ASPIC/UnbV domain-containing protein, partial [Planctomycetales bacterium]|nr:ASPIC/UnbV domain-containing protein [Planctomycetales bacterium]